jgi:RND family efflux transporter MFP subunit
MKKKIKEMTEYLQTTTVSVKNNVWNRIKKHYIKAIIASILVILIAFFIFKPKRIDPKTISLVPVSAQNLISTVSASGKVTSIVDLPLSFKKSDIVETVNVSVGDRVKKGQILATLKNQSELGLVTQARGALARVLDGSSNEEVNLAQTLLSNAKEDLENTKKLQNSLVENARRTLYSSGLEARAEDSVTGESFYNPTVFGSYTGTTEGVYKIVVYRSSGGYSFNVSGLSNGSGTVSASNSVSIGNGLSLQFPVNFNLGSNDTWIINIPNKESTSYTTNLNAYESTKLSADTAIAQAEALVREREANLALKKAKPRNADILSAEGQLQNALGAYENTVIRSPSDGVITKVAIKPGELAESLQPLIVVQDVSKLYVEADINESNITSVSVLQPVTFTIDAFGSSRTFSGTVIQVDGAPTITDGIVNYKIKASLDDKDPDIKTGMNANLTIVTNTKNDVLAIPGAALFKKDDKSFVRKITDINKKKFKEIEVVPGIVGDGNMTEIVSGLLLTDTVALIEK